MAQHFFPIEQASITHDAFGAVLKEQGARCRLLDAVGNFSFTGFFSESIFTLDQWRVESWLAFWGFEAAIAHVSKSNLPGFLDESSLPVDAGTVLFRFSDDGGTTFRYHDGTNWVDTTRPWHWNTLAQIDQFFQDLTFDDPVTGKRLTVQVKITPSQDATVQPTDTFDLLTVITGADLSLQQIFFNTGITFEVTTTGTIPGGTFITITGSDPYTIVIDIDPSATTIDGSATSVIETMNAHPIVGQLLLASRVSGSGGEIVNLAVASTSLSSGVTLPMGTVTPSLCELKASYDSFFSFEDDIRQSVGEYIRQNCRPQLWAVHELQASGSEVVLTTESIKYGIDSVLRVFNRTKDPGETNNIFGTLTSAPDSPTDVQGHAQTKFTITLTEAADAGDIIRVFYLATQDVEQAPAGSYHEVSKLPTILVRVPSMDEENRFNLVSTPTSRRTADKQNRKDEVQDFDAIVEIQALGFQSIGVMRTHTALFRLFRSRVVDLISLATGERLPVPEVSAALENLDAIPFGLHDRRLTLRIAGFEWTDFTVQERAIDTLVTRITAVP